jgi:peroxiredoxin
MALSFNSFQLTSTDFRGVVNRRFWANFLPFPATNQFYFDVGTPNFKLHDVTNDRDVELRDYREQTPLILAFTRIFTAKQYCPFCFPHLVELSDRYEEFRALGFEVLLITSTDRAQSQQVAQDLGLKMPLLSDPSCQIFRAYGVGQALGAPLPAQFLLDRDGKLRYRHLFSFIEPNAPLDRLLELAQPWGLTPPPAAERDANDQTSVVNTESAKSRSETGESETQTQRDDATIAANAVDETIKSSDSTETPTSLNDREITEPRTTELEIVEPEIVEPEIEPMPDTSQAIAFAAQSTRPLDDSQLETIDPELEPLPNLTAIVPIKRRQPWLDDDADAIAIDGEIVPERRDRR